MILVFTVGSRLYFVMVGAVQVASPGGSMAAPLPTNSSEAHPSLVLYTGLRVWTGICLPRQAIW